MPVDTMKKERVLIRFRPEIYECFELEAAYQGLRVGTIANQLLISELNKAASVKQNTALYLDRKNTLRFRRACEAAIMCCQKAKIL